MISVIMPVYNGSAFIAPAIESILHQTYPHFELIVVDDGSTDNSVALINEYRHRDRRVRLYCNPHSGVSRALNTGIHAAQHPFVAIMHADDIALPTRLERQLNMAQQQPGVLIWGSYGYHASITGEPISQFSVGPTSIEECHLLRSRAEVVQAIHPTVMFKRDVALDVGGYDPVAGQNAAEDIEFFDRMLEHGPLVTIPEPLLLYRVHPGSLTMQKYTRQLLIAEYVRERQRRRLANQPLETFDVFEARFRAASRRQRRALYRNAFVGANYRRAGIAYGHRKYMSAAYHFTLALAVNPQYTMPRIWQQWLKPRLNGPIQHISRTVAPPSI